MHRLRAVSVLPTLFTLGNLICGFFAIVAASRVEAPTSADIPTTSADSHDAVVADADSSRT